ncbi:MAG: cytochrome c maturation protein CcmE [Thalassolituus sp.]|jgi:cytochrome c-type biogenesis protein CcmE|uniref:Cytochrome c-type biogenesis protein CcmE n=3 Tax=root TaxID=1 RepID=M5DNI4_9GAMM|nr:cytochrome c maturation protein CcmE [Thalassolituus oleivorans]PCI48814.1 MAG: cytochrome c maturation protein CcmE [Oceanospirillales bacterium]AHK16340.1 cytochrome C biogenesis protein CcmC [Thalassolituus oleivorans R6-15]APR67730.1 cytochrome c biogenesis protein CcmE [Thalassolituus oleivorans]MBQ0780646.1 cytochrome c maturation protein CcmE [Thalassolituus oleivorans]MCA6127219.1 cytochrome C biogenesis protein CcmE [Thalassolituus oleivorans 4BN06-13]
MHPQRKKRLTLIVFLVIAVGSAVGLLMYSLTQNINLFMTPTQIANGEVEPGRTIRAGGLVEVGSVVRDGLSASFVVTDGASEVTITYDGILPDLFREGQGIVALGKLNTDGVFIASEVLAKHDENYMPPEVKDALEKAHLDGKQALEAARD